MAPRRHAAVLAAALCAAALTGCVTEVTPRETRTTRSVPSAGTQATALDGPIAEPARTAQVVNSRVVVAVKPLGRVPFDGQVLPVTTPDGRYLVTQTGRAPSWEMILAAPAAGVPLATDINAYTIVDTPERLTEVEPPVDAMIGRAAFGSTALIERTAPDGTRTIGSLDLRRGTPRDELGSAVGIGRSIVAHASASADGTVIAASSYDPGDEDAASIVVRWRDGSNRFEAEESLPGSALRFPTLSADGRTLFAFAQDSTGTELVTYRVGERPWAGEAPLVMTARRLISNANDPFVAYQAVSGLQAPAVVPPINRETPAAPGVLFFHPAQQRMAMFDPASGSLTLLEPQSIAGAWLARDDGRGGTAWSVFLTTPEGLKHQVLTRDRTGWSALPASTVIEEAFVPRATTDPERPYILIGPSKARPSELDVVVMRVAGNAG